jgi:hypothetical protein
MVLQMLFLIVSKTLHATILSHVAIKFELDQASSVAAMSTIADPINPFLVIGMNS